MSLSGLGIQAVLACRTRHEVLLGLYLGTSLRMLWFPQELPNEPAEPGTDFQKVYL